jgi:hypothetical protein
VKARHLMVPGLSMEAATRCGLNDTATRVARMVSSFPATLAAQQATLLTGSPPSEHGVLFAEDTSRLPALIEPWHAIDDSLLRGGSIEAVKLSILDAAESVDVLLVSGCPIGEAVDRIVHPAVSAPDGFRITVEDVFVLCEPTDPDRALPQLVIDEWLRTPGIERILAPAAESAGAWMAPSDRGWILVAERGWSFRKTAEAVGRTDGTDPVLLAFGRPWPAAWPTSVHDWRVAPTLLELLGQDGSGCFDAALVGAGKLGS